MTIMDLFCGVRLADPYYDVQFTPTGIPEFNATVQGLPQGRIVEISGEAASGKTALALHLATLTDQPAMMFSTEPIPTSNYLATFDPAQSASIIDVQGHRVESIVSTLINLFRSPAVRLVVLDSIDMLDSDESAVTTWGRYLPVLTDTLEKTDKTLIVTSQLRFHRDAMHSRDMSIMDVTGRAALRIRCRSYDFAKRTGRFKVTFATYPVDKREVTYAIPFSTGTSAEE